MISTLGIDDVNHLKSTAPASRKPNYKPNEQEFDVASIKLDDHGELEDSQALDEILAHIKTARKKNKNGVIVTLFAHGWHHGGEWDDSNYVSFRNLLASLCLREAERYSPTPGGRRVIGIYLAWDGDPVGSWLPRMPLLKHFTFWDRYETADNVGSGDDLHKIVSSLVLATKSPLSKAAINAGTESISPLILSGHSMGALLIELAFLSILKANEASLADNHKQTDDDVVDLRQDGKAILAPDLVLALNSAADSKVAEDIKAHLEQLKWRKIAESRDGGIRYNPPVMLSVTSLTDPDTGLIWRIARPSRVTDGHNTDLFTHKFTKLHAAVCNRRGPYDFGQSWHCVRRPHPAVKESPRFHIDLPVSGREEDHIRYKLKANNSSKEELVWIFQIPGELCNDHNDIFNPKMGSLVLAMIQISGAVMSLAGCWAQTFED